MDQSDTVEVFNFRVFDMGSHAMRLSRFKATREDVVRRFSGEVLEGTAEHVPRVELDEHGRYRRVASGWGELA